MISAQRYSPGVLLRVAGIPVSATEDLAAPFLPEAMDRSADLESRLKALAAELSDKLHGEVKSLSGQPALQHRYINLRRDVFNGRDVSAANLHALASPLSADVSERLLHWQRLKEELREHEAESERRLQDWQRLQRRRLQAIAVREDFQKGLQAASPSFVRALKDFLDWDGGTADRKVRRAEAVLLSYLFRSTHKTSPFSRLTVVALARIVDAPDEAAPLSAAGDNALVARVQPSMAVMARFRHAIGAGAMRLPRARLVLNPTAVVESGRMRYRRRGESVIPFGGPMHARVAEYPFNITLTPSLSLLRDRLAGGEVATVRELVDMLTNDLGMSDEEARAYIDILVKNDVLTVAGLRQSVFDPQCWEDFGRALSSWNEEEVADATGALSRLSRSAADYERCDASTRNRLVAEIGAQLDAAISGIDEQSVVPRPLFYEDAALGDAPLNMPRRSWETKLSDLAELHRALALFDPLLVSKLTLKVYFRRRYGQGGVCRDIAGFSDDFHDFFYRAFARAGHAAEQNEMFNQAVLNPMRIAEVSSLLSLQKEFQRYLRERLMEAPEEIVLPADMLSRLGAFAAGLHGFLSNSFLFQLDGRTERIVLNRVLGGTGSSFSRFEHLFRSEQGNPVRDMLEDNLSMATEEGALFAEVQGGHETNLNQHSLTAAAEIVLPGERGSAPQGRRIALTELSIRHDRETDSVSLFCERLGKTIRPVFAGLLHPLAMPELQTLLLHFASPFSLPLDHLERAVESDGGPPNLPRLRYKQVVLERAKWTVDFAAFPARGRQETDYSYVLRVHRWREASQMPRKCFAQVSSRANGTGEGEGSGREKPFYVDLANTFCLAGLEKAINGSDGRVIFSEALPLPGDTPLLRGGERHTCEFAVEITQRNGGP